MASSSTSARSRPRGDHLPLIMCPDCGEVQVETNISGVPGPNMGRRFYKCPIDNGPNKCGWFKWEESYAGILTRRQTAAIRAQPRGVNQAEQGDMMVPQPSPARRPQQNTAWGTNWMMIALMANIAVNIILTIALIGCM
uniref:GRF-type domain-containing protein n=1 Tax=Hordeum vulgare subsp. vulgare TaxID=112509 RepID=A0A8I6Y7L0_HORVV